LSWPKARTSRRQCRRLIKNAIICWNYLYLARELDRQPDQGHREALLNAMRNGSVGAYGHSNLHGEFDFSTERMVDSIGPTASQRFPEIHAILLAQKRAMS
jgi:Tn3 transposase DDE domain-containing protein